MIVLQDKFLYKIYLITPLNREGTVHAAIKPIIEITISISANVKAFLFIF